MKSEAITNESKREAWLVDSERRKELTLYIREATKIRNDINVE